MPAPQPKIMMHSYQETIEYLFNRLPMFTRIGAAAYKANLNNIIALCDVLGNPQQKFKSIHIAGTNGKGSTSCILASVLQTHQYKTGLFTSPHIKDFRERIRINGVCVTEQWVTAFVQKHFDVIEQMKPSFFEITTAMAFTYFAEQEVDIAIIEVGMGGLLDSTNIINPILSVITNIGLDHTQFLGTTLAEIAVNKAGIIKAKTPVVIGETHPETEMTFVQKANSLVAPIYFADTQYDAVISKSDNNKLQCIKLVDKAKLTIETYYLDLLGNYQTKNIKSVMMACQVLKQLGYKISQEKIYLALQHTIKNTGIKGRFEIVQERPTIIYDVAHNKEGLLTVLNQVNKIPHQMLHIICGFVADKDVVATLKIFPLTSTCYYTQAQIPRALAVGTLAAHGREIGLNGEAFANINLALEAAKKNADIHDIILVCGSFFILAEIENY